MTDLAAKQVVLTLNDPFVVGSKWVMRHYEQRVPVEVVERGQTLEGYSRISVRIKPHEDLPEYTLSVCLVDANWWFFHRL
jgi:beta-galactosidase GanA